MPCRARSMRGTSDPAFSPSAISPAIVWLATSVEIVMAGPTRWYPRMPANTKNDLSRPSTRCQRLKDACISVRCTQTIACRHATQQEHPPHSGIDHQGDGYGGCRAVMRTISSCWTTSIPPAAINILMVYEWPIPGHRSFSRPPGWSACRAATGRKPNPASARI